MAVDINKCAWNNDITPEAVWYPEPVFPLTNEQAAKQSPSESPRTPLSAVDRQENLDNEFLTAEILQSTSSPLTASTRKTN